MIDIKREVSERFNEFLNTECQGNGAACAEKIGKPKSTVNNIVNGRVLPSGDVLMLLAKHYDLSINWLLTGNGNKKYSIDTDYKAKYEELLEDYRTLAKEVMNKR